MPIRRYIANLPRMNGFVMAILGAENLCSKPATLRTGYRHHVSGASLSTVRGTASADVCYLGKQLLPPI